MDQFFTIISGEGGVGVGVEPHVINSENLISLLASKCTQNALIQSMTFSGSHTGQYFFWGFFLPQGNLKPNTWPAEGYTDGPAVERGFQFEIEVAFKLPRYILSYPWMMMQK